MRDIDCVTSRSYQCHGVQKEEGAYRLCHLALSLDAVGDWRAVGISLNDSESITASLSDRKSTRLNSSHVRTPRMPSSA